MIVRDNALYLPGCRGNVLINNKKQPFVLSNAADAKIVYSLTGVWKGERDIKMGLGLCWPCWENVIRQPHFATLLFSFIINYGKWTWVGVQNFLRSWIIVITKHQSSSRWVMQPTCLIFNFVVVMNEENRPQLGFSRLLLSWRIHRSCSVHWFVSI